ncbi:glutamine amidotransferase-related protein [Sneathiella chinensis]|uniref:Glutamine amidotransferase n=1 Tax=Sneathiella chinensis TaxID=349750 RepID=A0ABQ5U3H0_9PROT|nr:gamma-glutamyl-gamma-aminobutyrate hydrolase family protein [Sneathiella chinensis]GLQ05829.1 glutamine amidotransferase [Sneathiella chinensis]
MITVGILQTGIVGGQLAADYGEYPDMFKEMFADEPFVYEDFSVVNGEFPTSTDQCDAWIITGSKHGAYEDHDWIPPLEEFVRQLVAEKRPTIGICFGHQIMAQALGGKVEKHSNGWGIGVHAYRHPTTGEETRLLAFHQDQVTECPAGADVIMTSDFCRYAGLQYSDACITLQPHPEHSAAFAHDLLQDRRGRKIAEELVDDALTTLEQPVDRNRLKDRLAAVLKKGARETASS